MKQKDCIIIENLNVFAHHGVYPEETRDGQNFYVNAVLYTDTKKAGYSDELEDSTNYGEVCQEIHRFLTEHTYKLLEAAAEKLAEYLLQTFPLIQELTLEIRKPEAPIPLPFESVSVKIHRGWNRAFIALGSNIGDRQAYIGNALKHLGEDGNIRNIRVSTLIETKAYGGVEQEDFLNGVLECETLYSPERLLLRLQEEEQLAQRKREIHWGPRTLDLDVLFYEDEVWDKAHLTIPHPDMINRDFVLKPMSELAPNFVHPVYRCTMKELLQQYLKSTKV
ncbi:MAG: 2-amino-4-hydroxy-6-hydroxymethyldihydropteridine diphosphokinase [Lachnospiraceae bacterium]|nr:2-amino-4-hydroxy-6-hydroxymethyldihydropteridine diphosphokinase [Lachnospiraceae bacterium]